MGEADRGDHLRGAGPTGHWFYGNLDSLIPGATARKVATKVFIDQVLWNPIFGVMFFGYMAATEGKGPMLVARRIKNDLMTQVRCLTPPVPRRGQTWLLYLVAVPCRAGHWVMEGLADRPRHQLCLCAHEPASALHQLHSDRLQHVPLSHREPWGVSE